MDVIKKARRMGKTTEAAKLSNETGAYLVVINRDHAKELNSSGKTKRNPVTFDEFRQDNMRGSFVRNIVIDDFDIFIQQELSNIFSQFSGLKIEGISFTEEPTLIFKRMYESMILKKESGK